MRLRWVTVLAATTMVVSSLAAQDAGGYGPGARGGWGGRGRDGGWGGHRVGDQGFVLRKRDEVFDKSLAFLTKDQRKQYDDWKKDEKKAREERRDHRFRGDGGESRPGS